MRAALVALLVAVAAGAHEPGSTPVTWGREISRIFARRCAGCHQPGSPGGALMRYEQVRARLAAVRRAVLRRSMPPWGAVKGFGALAADPSLTGEEIRLVAEWIEGGAPQGDPRLVPAFPGPEPPGSPEPGRRLPLPQKILRPLTVTALIPRADVPEARIVAVLPGGRVVPLLRLHGYRAAWRRTFRLAEPVRLPSGSRLEIAPLQPVDAVIR